MSVPNEIVGIARESIPRSPWAWRWL